MSPCLPATHRAVGDAVVVCVVVAGVANVIPVGVFLAGVGGDDAVVLAAPTIAAAQVEVCPSVQVTIGAAGLAVAGPPNLTLKHKHCDDAHTHNSRLAMEDAKNKIIPSSLLTSFLFLPYPPHIIHYIF